MLICVGEVYYMSVLLQCIPGIVLRSFAITLLPPVKFLPNSYIFIFIVIFMRNSFDNFAKSPSVTIYPKFMGIVWSGCSVITLIGKHTIFGRVCKGMEIIKRLGSVQTDNTDRFVGSFLFCTSYLRFPTYIRSWVLILVFCCIAALFSFLTFLEVQKWTRSTWLKSLK